MKMGSFIVTYFVNVFLLAHSWSLFLRFVAIFAIAVMAICSDDAYLAVFSSSVKLYDVCSMV